MQNKITKLFLVIILLISIILITGCVEFNEQSQIKETAFVEKVIDGDTIKLDTSETVRLLGINTPEKNEFYHNESKQALIELIEGKEIYLEKDITDKDKYGRSLRYAYLDNFSVNEYMLENGYAHTFFVGPDTKYADEFVSMENRARSQKIGIWQGSDVSSCIAVYYFNYNAEGNDELNLNDEYVVFVNYCEEKIDLTGWKIKDEATHIYVFPEIEIRHNQMIAVHTGSGSDTSTDLYWKQTKSVWNNDYDTLFLQDSEGKLVLDYPYSEE